jgi:threonine aldolase
MWALHNNPDGSLDLDKVRAGIADESDEHVARTALLCIENTHNRCGGTVLGVEQVDALAEVAHTHGIALHIDGARIFNAAISLGVPVSILVRNADSVMFCLSKGLSAPVGSLLVGSKAFMRRAHRARKLLGGGMRQAGIVAAAGIVALDHMVDRLAEDHENCKRLAYGLADYPQIEVEPERVVTNMVMFTLRDSQGRRLTEALTQQFLDRAREHGVLIGGMGGGTIRAVTHYGIESQHVTDALKGIRQALIEMHLST